MNEHIRRLHDLGQRVWLDDISRSLLRSGALRRYISEYAVTGLTCDPTTFAKAFGTDDYDDGIRALNAVGVSGEELYFDLALEDVRQAADLFRPIFDASDGADGWVSVHVSPLLAHDSAHTVQAANRLFDEAACTNLSIAMAGTPQGLRAVEEVIFFGVPVNVSLLYSREHFLAAAEAHMRGLERRVIAGLDPDVSSVASMVVGRWDVVVKEEVSMPFHDRLGIAMAMRTYRAHHELLASDRWQKLAARGARPQRLLWTGLGTEGPAARDTLYVEAVTAPRTIAAMPQHTLMAFADHGRTGSVLPADGGYADAVLEEFRREGVDDDALASRLQREGVDAFATSWHATLSRIAEKSTA